MQTRGNSAMNSPFFFGVFTVTVACFVFAAVWGKQGEVLHAQRGVRDDWPSWTGIQKVRETAWHDARKHYPLLCLIYDEDESAKKHKSID